MFYERLTKLCSDNNISLTTLVQRELKMSVSNVTKWKEGKVPKIDTVMKIATYFNVSTDYLIGKEQKNKPITDSDRLDPLDRKIMDMIRSLSPEKRKIAEAQIEVLLKLQDNE